MSAGHDKFDDAPGSIAKLRALLVKFPAVGLRLRKWRYICRGFDIPYLGGISEDGQYVYVDRNLPSKVSGVPLDKFIEVHEAIEAAFYHSAVKDAKLHDALGKGDLYELCHHLATAAENIAVLGDGYEWEKYKDGLRPDYMPIEHEEIRRVPPDLDLYPYASDAKLLAHMQGVMKKSKFTQEEVRYREGGKTSKCGNCAMFLPRLGKCTWVEGAIASEMVCDKFEMKH